MEEEKSVVEDYIKKGLEKGFNIKYIKEVLIKHGHSSSNVETAANNIIGLRYPEKLKPHLDEVRTEKQKTKSPKWLYALIIILILISGFFVVNYLLNRSEVGKVQSQLDEIENIGVDIDDLSTTMKTQMALIKEKDLTIDEKEKIIEDQIKTIEKINDKIQEQKTKLNSLLLDIMNRMIGRMSG
ncbi:hypothetical protein CEE44_03030 [Candidatus Woesearchaeota archaeon B3_Woes]|nr:MAG: hypothetical protein CEE44_03030 [Candidatus Woesearchaeota archaeon B3_Woes]